MATYKLFILPGDGIGPEVMAEVEKVIACSRAPGLRAFEIEKGLVGGCAYDAHGRRSAMPTWRCAGRRRRAARRGRRPEMGRRAL